MNFYNLNFSKNIRFDVEDVEDYHIVGTFDPNAACDTEFFGYRETTFNVVNVESRYEEGSELWLPDTEDTVKEFKNYFDDRLTLIVQDAIDKQGEM